MAMYPLYTENNQGLSQWVTAQLVVLPEVTEIVRSNESNVTGKHQIARINSGMMVVHNPLI